jgi:hypothetical protein
MKEKRVPDMVREREMNDVRNYNRNQQARVFENEKRQVARYADTKAPESAKDIGSTFKLQVYTLKLQAILQQKQDAIGQTELVIGTANRTLPDGTVEITLGASQMRQGQLAPYVNTIFGKADILNSFNEMMSFIKSYMSDVFSDDDLRDTVYTAYLTPVSEMLVSTAGQFPQLYDFLQVRDARNADGSRPNEAQLRAMADARGLSQKGENDYRAKQIFRQQAIQVYSLLMAMAENINIQALRPVTAKDVDEYAQKNDVGRIITTRGRPVVPGPAPLPAGPPILPQRPDEPPPPAPPAVPPGIDQPNLPFQPPPQPAPQPAPPQGGQPTFDTTLQLLQAFEQANPAQVQDPLKPAQYGGLTQFRRAVRDFNQNDPVGQQFPQPANVRVIEQARSRLVFLRGQQGQQQPQQGQQTPPRARSPSPQGQQGGPASPQQQGQQGGPAQQVDIRLRQQLSPGGADITVGDNVRTALRTTQNSPVDIPDRFRDVADRMVSRIKGAEDARGGIFRYRNDADVNEIHNSLANSTLGLELDNLMPDEGGQKMFIRDIMRGMMLVRAERADQLSGQPNSGRQRELYGMGKRSNAKVFLRGCGVPEDIIGTAMMRHGLPDDALVEDLEGSGILDTLKNFAGSVADSASGWYDTIKANMPTMSDVRRAVGKIVPDSLQEYVPSGLKRTFGDKAKDFFGFGMSGGEFHGDPRPTHARHREAFDNFFDNRGYRQGAVQRMTTMFVPDWELSSGLNRLKGGDQLSEHDPEVMRRQDHHDVSLYKPVVIQQPIHGYGHDGDEDSQYEGGLKQRLRKPIAPDVIGRPYRKDPMLVHRVEDHDEFQPRTVGDEGLSHYEELEKPADMDEDPNPFRVRTENHRVNTGKMKKVTYHTK